MPALAIQGLEKRFGPRTALTGIDLTVADGELLAVLGASGSGKTTLLRLLCGFERLDAGEIRIGDRMVANARLHLPPERRRIGYVAQEAALFPHLTVAENLLFGLPRSRRRDLGRAREWLAMVGLPADYLPRPPSHLSGGEQQRVALARALAPEPDVLLLDEPFSALDAALRSQTRALVTDLIADRRVTAVLVTHDQAEALSMGRRVAVLRRGELAQLGPPREIYARPADAELAAFLGEAAFLDAMAEGEIARCALGHLPLAGAGPSGPVRLMVRPEQFRLGPPDAAKPGAIVTAISFHGPDSRLTLSLGGVLLTARAPGAPGHRVGDAVGLEVAGPAVAYPRP